MKLNAIDLARLKHQLRCPDCDSKIRIDRTCQPFAAHISHDDTCPALRALTEQGRTFGVVIAAEPPICAVYDQPSLSMRLLDSPYSGVHNRRP